MTERYTGLNRCKAMAIPVTGSGWGAQRDPDALKSGIFNVPKVGFANNRTFEGSTP